MKAMCVALASVVAAVLVGTALHGQDDGPVGGGVGRDPRVPYITLTASATTGGSTVIKGAGEWGAGPYKFKAIDMFAAPADGGIIYRMMPTIGKEPLGKAWPDPGVTVGIQIPNDTYSVWAVLTLTDGNNQDVLIGSTVTRGIVVTGSGFTGGKAESKGNKVSWSGTDPAGDKGSINGSGTYTVPVGEQLERIQMTTVPAKGGQFSSLVAASTDPAPTPPTWTAVVSGQTKGTTYEVFGIMTLKSGIQYSTVVKTATP